jgi:hypothetical protein
MMRRFAVLCFIIASLCCASFGQTAGVIQANEAAASHVNELATVEGVVVKVFTSKNGNTFLNFGAPYPNQTFTGWIPAGTPLATDASIPTLQGEEDQDHWKN